MKSHLNRRRNEDFEIKLRRMKKLQDFPFFCRMAEMNFQHLAGPRNVSVDFK